MKRKNSLLICLMIIMTASCSDNNYSRFSYTKTANPWIDKFKDIVFFSALKESYKNDTIFNLINKVDAFNPYDGVEPEYENMAKELGKKLVQQMPPPVMCENCKDGKNYYMSICLHYYKSRELDTIAKSAHKKALEKRS